jgi:hypothetical protein
MPSRTSGSVRLSRRVAARLFDEGRRMKWRDEIVPVLALLVIA